MPHVEFVPPSVLRVREKGSLALERMLAGLGAGGGLPAMGTGQGALRVPTETRVIRPARLPPGVDSADGPIGAAP